MPASARDTHAVLRPPSPWDPFREVHLRSRERCASVSCGKQFARPEPLTTFAIRPVSRWTSGSNRFVAVYSRAYEADVLAVTAYRETPESLRAGGCCRI